MERRGDGEGRSGTLLGEPASERPPREGRRGTLGAPDHALLLRLGSEPGPPESSGPWLSTGGAALSPR